jgi:hypothetical protein
MHAGESVSDHCEPVGMKSTEPEEFTFSLKGSEHTEGWYKRHEEEQRFVYVTDCAFDSMNANHKEGKKEYHAILNARAKAAAKMEKLAAKAKVQAAKLKAKLDAQAGKKMQMKLIRYRKQREAREMEAREREANKE